MIVVSRDPAPPPRGLAGKTFRFTSDRGDLDEGVFFLVPEALGSIICEVDEAIVPLAGMLALVRGEDIDLGGIEADALLIRNVRAGLGQMRQWYPEFATPELVAVRESDTAPQAPESGAVCLLSGGVDSMFTLLRHSGGNSALPESATRRELTHAVHIFHTPTADVDLDRTFLDALESSAKLRGLEFVKMFTNMMTFDRQLADRWADVAHGAGLASVLHIFSRIAGTGLMASTHTFGGLMPWGSSPLVDPLWSSNRMRIIHDGSTYQRAEKTAFIARSPEFIESLNVCDNRVEDVGYSNCSQCPKCLRTMVTLDLCSDGETAQFTAFDWSGYEPSKIATIFLRTENDRAFIREIEGLAKGRRPDIVAACQKALARSTYLSPVSAIEKRVKKSSFGRRNRDALIALRGAIYRSAGWATKQ